MVYIQFFFNKSKSLYLQIYPKIQSILNSANSGDGFAFPVAVARAKICNQKEFLLVE